MAVKYANLKLWKIIFLTTLTIHRCVDVIRYESSGKTPTRTKIYAYQHAYD